MGESPRTRRRQLRCATGLLGRRNFTDLKCRGIAEFFPPVFSSACVAGQQQHACVSFLPHSCGRAVLSEFTRNGCGVVRICLYGTDGQQGYFTTRGCRRGRKKESEDKLIKKNSDETIPSRTRPKRTRHSSTSDQIFSQRLHLSKSLDHLSDKIAKNRLSQEINSLDLGQLDRWFHSATHKLLTHSPVDAPPESIVHRRLALVQSRVRRYKVAGLRNIAKGKIAVLFLAGGRATRMNGGAEVEPTALLNPGLPSGKTLLQLAFQRVFKIAELAGDELNFDQPPHIQALVMTSPFTHSKIVEYLGRNSNFKVVKTEIFQQSIQPAFDVDGRILFESPSSLSYFPNGTGGLVQALSEQGIIQRLKEDGVVSVHVVDPTNIACKPCDPSFVGFAAATRADFCAKVVPRILPDEEDLGILAISLEGTAEIVPPEELPATVRQLRGNDANSSGFELPYGALVDALKLLEKVANLGREALPTHAVLKHLTKRQMRFGKKSTASRGHDSVDPLSPNAVVLERNIWDVVHWSKRPRFWEVDRAEEYAAIRRQDENQETSSLSTPSTARSILYSVHRRQILASSGSLVDSLGRRLSDSNNANQRVEPAVEISPLVSYEGENLGRIVKHQTIRVPCLLESSSELNEARQVSSEGVFPGFKPNFLGGEYSSALTSDTTIAAYSASVEPISIPDAKFRAQRAWERYDPDPDIRTDYESSSSVLSPEITSAQSEHKSSPHDTASLIYRMRKRLSAKPETLARTIPKNTFSRQKPRDDPLLKTILDAVAAAETRRPQKFIRRSVMTAADLQENVDQNPPKSPAEDNSVNTPEQTAKSQQWKETTVTSMGILLQQNETPVQFASGKPVEDIVVQPGNQKANHYFSLADDVSSTSDADDNDGDDGREKSGRVMNPDPDELQNISKENESKPAPRPKSLETSDHQQLLIEIGNRKTIKSQPGNLGKRVVIVMGAGGAGRGGGGGGECEARKRRAANHRSAAQHLRNNPL
ncbi:unnamed protein product [Notodromas monacha]|uniref:UDP-N-acetylglucosamine diphosphorylase n=1 Tax=Notodromas monacha TaxID=399045 RepID=A0A7R9BIS9_9CRUS|nr:unnamed protein product [Notodromas monacha]CAG0915985.1 unnamed protein product [Notodromas monacha]